MKSLACFCLFLIFSTLFFTDVVNAQTIQCNPDETKPQGLSEIKIDTNGLVKERKVISWENKGGSCILKVMIGSDNKGDRKVKFNKAYDSKGNSIQPIIIDEIYLIQYDELLESGKVYRIYIETELEKKIKESDGSFYFSSDLQISKFQDPVAVIEIEKLEPWWKIKFNQTTPFPDSILDDNKLVWRLDDPKTTRTIEKIEIEYSYIFDWNVIWLLLIGGFIGVFLDRLPKIFRKIKETKIVLKIKK